MIPSIMTYLKNTGFEHFVPKAVLFDMDGVLYDSMPNHAKAWVQCMENYGLTMTEEDAYLYEGMRGVETIKLLAGKQWGKDVTEGQAEKIYKDKSKIYSKFPAAKQINGVHDLQETITERGWKIGVVTGSGQKTLLQRIKRDFKNLVSPEILVCANDVKQGKPAPDPYQKGMLKAGTEPWQTIVVENAPLGVRAAVAAQCFTIAVNTGPLPDSALEKEGADMVLPSMVALNELLAKTFPNDDDTLFC
jgi:beta-phosphoglucomutase